MERKKHYEYYFTNIIIINIIIIIIIIIIITFIQYVKQVKSYKSHKNGLFKPEKKLINKLMKVDKYS